jgi:hypothetical protein
MLAIIAALASAAFWFQSARITTPTEFHILVGRSDFPPIGSTGLTARSPALAELGAKLARQSNLNAYAALSACICTTRSFCYPLDALACSASCNTTAKRRFAIIGPMRLWQRSAEVRYLAAPLTTKSISLPQRSRAAHSGTASAAP